MDGLDILVTPAAPGEAPKGIGWTGEPAFNSIWTSLHVPCVTVPAGFGPNGLPLGILPHLVSGPPEVVELYPGDMLVLATDGFFEWANPKGDQFGVTRIREIIRLAREKPPRELISALYQAVIEFSEGTHQQDDLTAVVVKRV